jgi:hypothetical protein
MDRFAQRQLTARVLETLERRVKQFRRREEFWPLRIPSQPILVEDLVTEALGEERNRFDPSVLRTRRVLQLEWDQETVWQLWMLALPSKTKLYLDADGEEMRLLASGGRNEGDENDRVFLQLLAETAGAAFGIEFAGGAPARVRSSIADRDFLVAFFVNLFEISGSQQSVRAVVGNTLPGERRDFQLDVEAWLNLAFRP